MSKLMGKNKVTLFYTQNISLTRHNGDVLGIMTGNVRNHLKASTVNNCYYDALTQVLV